MTTCKNPAAVALGRVGGLVKSEAKASANRDKMLKLWADRRAGIAPPRKPRKKRKTKKQNNASQILKGDTRP